MRSRPTLARCARASSGPRAIGGLLATCRGATEQGGAMSGSGHVEVSGLRVDPTLHEFVTAELVPGSGVAADQVWDGLAELVRTFAPRHRDLLAVRDRLQAQIDEWHRSHPADTHDAAAYR